MAGPHFLLTLAAAGALLAQASPAPDVTRSDVVIVGAGISGLAAAIEAEKAGATVTVLDMWSVFGGHAVMSEGGVTMVDTPVQRAQGIVDSPDIAYRDFLEYGEDADEHWVRRYVDRSRSELHDWLTALGVRFESVAIRHGNSVPRFHKRGGEGWVSWLRSTSSASSSGTSRSSGT